MPILTSEQNVDTLSAEQLEQGKQLGSLVIDDKRRRPLWFDGRFLDAAALNQQQSYYIAKQQDIAQLVGSGVVSGLMVEQDSRTARTLVITEGRGLTPSGKLVVLEEDLSIDLAELAQIQALNLQFELSQIPAQSLSNTSGIFILALRPVEFSSDPITSYPTDINGERSVADGSVFEATAVTLIPYTDQGARTELQQRRKHIAAEIFVNGSEKGQPADVLPLAMLAIQKGVIEWLDPYLVRRSLSNKKHALAGLGASPRELREAFYTQYKYQLDDIIQQGRNQAFAASEAFNYLPPAGPMPLACVNLDDFSQVYFPAGMDVELSIIPEDELFMMLEESFSLPPIDLSLSEEKAEATSIMVLLAVPRHKVRALSLKLPSLVEALSSVAADAASGFSSLDILSAVGAQDDELAALESGQSAWREAFQDADVSLWYTRRRTVNFKTEIIGEPVSLLRDESEDEQALEERVNEINFSQVFNQMLGRTTIAARAEVTSLLGKLRPSPLILRSAIRELDRSSVVGEIPRLNRLRAIGVTERFSVNKLGEGISRLQNTASDFDEDDQVSETLAETGRVPELDIVASRLKDSELRVFSSDLLNTIREGDGDQTTRVKQLIDDKLLETNALRKVPFLGR
ncbi:hypothetical protein SAMN02745866_01767 [Alteromonadaceae bacterium Bs31]|nr:hypothetical protein SAMN02745866_01767 [Alteromonadaceae bacterium Bs31]